MNVKIECTNILHDTIRNGLGLTSNNNKVNYNFVHQTSHGENLCKAIILSDKNSLSLGLSSQVAKVNQQ